MKKTLFLYVLLGILGCIPSLSWSMHFKTLTMNDGLSNNTVKSIAQDNHGFMWFGTFNGLCRYDGMKMTTYLPSKDNPQSLSGYQVTSLLHTSDGLWAGTDQGLDLYSPDDNHFHPASTEQGQLLGGISQIIEAGHCLYVLTHDKRLYKQKKGTLFTALSPIGKTPYKAIASYTGPYLLLATSDTLYIIHTENNQILSELSLTNAPAEVDDYILYYSKASQKVYLGFGIGYGSHAFHIQPDLQLLPCKDAVPSHLKAVIDNGKDVLFGTDCTGLFLLHDGELEVFTPQNCDISSDAIHSLFSDKENNLWIGTYRRGINILAPRYNVLHTLTFNERQLPHPVITSLIRHDRFIYAGTDGGGLAIYSLTDKSHRTLTSSNSPLLGNNILSMAKDAEGFWMSVYGEGLCYYSYTRQAITRTLRISDHQGNSCRFIWQIAFDPSGRLWVIGDKACIVDPETGHTESLGPHFHDCNSICITPEHTWIVTDDGLYRLNTATHQVENQFSEFLHGETAKEVYEDPQGNVWVSASSRLLQMDTKGRIIASYELPVYTGNNKITSIADDFLGHLWLGTENGLYRFDKQTSTFVRFDEEKRNLFAQFCPHSTYHDGQELYFGSTAGLVYFRTDEAMLKATFSPVYFDHIYLERSRQRIPLGETQGNSVTLAHNDNFFTLHFSVPDLLTARKINIAYKLDQFDRHWNISAPTRQIAYTNVPPGTYTFLIAATDEAGNMDSNPSRLTLRIKHPWWNTPGMRLLWILLGIGIVSGALKAYIAWGHRKVIAHQREVEALARRKMDEEKMNFFSGITHELRTPLFLIGAPLEELLQKKEAILQLPYRSVERMHHNVNRLNNLINQITAFRKFDDRQLKAHIGPSNIVECLQTLVEEFRISKQKNIGFVFNSPATNWIVDFDREKVELIISNLLSNAYKYTPAGGSISVSIAREHQNLLIDVADTGIGIPNDQLEKIFQKYYRMQQDDSIKGDGVGLAFVKELVEIVGGSITVDSQIGKGTTFHLSIPLNGLQQKSDTPPAETATPDALSEESGKAPLSPPANLQQILLIDDDRQTLDLLEQSLATSYLILRSQTAEEGIQLAIQHTPDLIVTDIIMPNMNGFQLVTEIKSHEKLCSTPIIMFSAKESDDDKIRAFQSGADAYITKPVSLRYMKARIDSLIAQKERLKSQGLTQWSRQRDAHYSPQDRIFIIRLRNVIEQLLSEGTPTSVELLAEEMNMSYSALYKKVKLLTDSSVIDFLNDYRIIKAIQYFKEGNRNIAEVAEKCGFSDIRAFRSAFKARLNTTPKQYLQDL